MYPHFFGSVFLFVVVHSARLWSGRGRERKRQEEREKARERERREIERDREAGVVLPYTCCEFVGAGKFGSHCIPCTDPCAAGVGRFLTRHIPTRERVWVVEIAFQYVCM